MTVIMPVTRENCRPVKDWDQLDLSRAIGHRGPSPTGIAGDYLRAPNGQVSESGRPVKRSLHCKHPEGAVMVFGERAHHKRRFMVEKVSVRRHGGDWFFELHMVEVEKREAS